MAFDLKHPFTKDDDLKDALRNDLDLDLGDIPHKRKRQPKDEAPQSDAPVRTRRAASMADAIGIFVNDLNGVLLMMPWTHDDALTEIEEVHLVKSWDSAQKVDKRLRGWTEKITTTGGRIGLVGCIAGIIAARLIKHGIIPMPTLSEAQQQMMREQAAKMGYAQEAREAGYTGNGFAAPNPYMERPIEEDSGQVVFTTPDGMSYRTQER